MEVEVYTIKDCVYCNLVKMFLKENSIPFKEFHMEIGGDEFLQKKKKWFKHVERTLPPPGLGYDKKVKDQLHSISMYFLVRIQQL